VSLDWKAIAEDRQEKFDTFLEMTEKVVSDIKNLSFVNPVDYRRIGSKCIYLLEEIKNLKEE
jgi:hypothetical protein